MFKPVSLAAGLLASEITAASVVMVVTLDLANKLAQVLGEESAHHTYMLLGDERYGEVVRVDGVYDGIVTITRARDNTTARAFTAGTPVRYYFCASAVQDMIDAVSLPAIEVVGTGPITVTENPNGHYEIGMSEPSLYSSNGSVQIAGQYPNYDLTVNASAFGLCDTGISTGY